MGKFSLLIFILLLVVEPSDAQIFRKNASKNAEKELFGKSGAKEKKVKVKEPRAVTKAKKKQEANERRLKKDYAKAVKKSQKRSYDIQTPEVQARMKQNKKDIIARDHAKRKNIKSNTKEAGKKYK